MNKHIKNSIFFICILVLTACNGQPAPTTTPAPTKTSAPPTATLTPQPTDTPTPTELPPVVLGIRQKNDAGGYSLQAPLSFETKMRNTQATINSRDNGILITMSIVPRTDDKQTAEMLIDGFLANVGKDVKDLKTGETVPAKVGTLDGFATDVSGTMFDTKNTGRVMVADMGKTGFFITFALVADGPDSNRWQVEGNQVFDAVINSLEFYEPIASTSGDGPCVVSSDPTYGYTQENPIKVGGDAFDGPPRERAYLDNLLGPKGEKLSYTRGGSVDFGDTILDTFVISGLNKKVTLYVDEYSFSEPQAPVGFSCLSAFSLTKP